MDNKDKIIREQREEIRLLSEALAAALFLAGCGQTSGSGNEPEYEIEVQTEETDEETEIMTMNVQVGDAINSQTITQAGDIVLYQGNQRVMFYGSNSWSYARIGHIADLTGWEEALGKWQCDGNLFSGGSMMQEHIFERLAREKGITVEEI